MARLPPILGGAPSQPLDVGRASRVITPAQRSALAVRDGGCVFPDYQRPRSPGARAITCGTGPMAAPPTWRTWPWCAEPPSGGPRARLAADPRPRRPPHRHPTPSRPPAASTTTDRSLSQPRLGSVARGQGPLPRLLSSMERLSPGLPPCQARDGARPTAPAPPQRSQQPDPRARQANGARPTAPATSCGTPAPPPPIPTPAGTSDSTWCRDRPGTSCVVAWRTGGRGDPPGRRRSGTRRCGRSRR
jgi:hypothetical protein